MQPLRTHRITIKKDIIGHLKVCRDIIAHADLTSFNGIKQNNQSPYFLASLVFFITMPVSAVGAAIDALFALVLPQDNFIRLTLKYLVRLVVGLTYLSISILSSCLLLLLSIPDLFLIGVDVVLCLGLYVIALIVVPCLVHLVLSVLLCLAVVLTAVAWVCSSSILFFLPAITCGPLFVLTVYTHPVVLVVAIPLSILFLFLTCELFADNEALWIFPISLYLILGLCIGGGVALGLLMHACVHACACQILRVLNSSDLRNFSYCLRAQICYCCYYYMHEFEKVLKSTQIACSLTVDLPNYILIILTHLTVKPSLSHATETKSIRSMN